MFLFLNQILPLKGMTCSSWGKFFFKFNLAYIFLNSMTFAILGIETRTQMEDFGKIKLAINNINFNCKSIYNILVNSKCYTYTKQIINYSGYGGQQQLLH